MNNFVITLLLTIVVTLSSERVQAKKSRKLSSPNSLCWQDYCPCKPPQGGADAGICRMLKAGMYVDPQILAGAAMSRDGRKQMDEFEQKYGKF